MRKLSPNQNLPRFKTSKAYPFKMATRQLYPTFLCMTGLKIEPLHSMTLI